MIFMIVLSLWCKGLLTPVGASLFVFVDRMKRSHSKAEKHQVRLKYGRKLEPELLRQRRGTRKRHQKGRTWREERT